ncbi:non-ribosomal peptide synthetase [Iningainema tapete]|uniref:Amino acid adenylation domain-containing protein n=1 Tax=Iningainema tapete BLCC-T55 TaxID=2748662 RepID=A0A8J7BZF9_9CYAN|nr:non-ribosomal peptide synthetase [Iningainema tapete]MBD2775788.1 amino acid adenylation domain-containing protein [Iningainema tapete BLCC-T55]
MDSAVGIRALAVNFPGIIHTKEDWLKKFPELVDRVNSRRARLPVSTVSTSNHPDLDIWSQEVAPYLSDPFRGNVERRVLSQDESSLTLEYRAAKEALEAAELCAEDVELLIVASFCPAQIGPGNACYLAHQLGLRCPAWNLESTCSSALIALQNASALIQTGTYRNVLIVVSHIGSKTVDEEDTLSWSMGDGAGAFVVDTLKPNQGVLSTKIIHTAATCGAYSYEITTNTQGQPQILTRTGENASALAETSVDFVRICCKDAVAAAGVTLEQIDFFAFNTPTPWYASVCTRALGIDPERIINLYPRYANIGPVLPIANLYHAAQSGKIRENDLVLVYTIGAAATAAATVMRWGDAKLGTNPAATVKDEKIQHATINSSIPEIVNVETTSLSREILAAKPEERQQLLETSLLQWLAAFMQSDSDIDPHERLTSYLDSLMALTFKNRIETDLAIRVPMEHFFGENNLAQLASLLVNQLALANPKKNDTSLPVIVPASTQRYEPFPLTDMQHAFWVGRSGVLDLGNVSNHGYYEIEGNDLNLERLNWTLQKLIERHDMLRAIVLPNGQQQILKQVPAYQMEVLDLRAKDDIVNQELEAIRDRLSHQVIPADQWPLFDFRATLLDRGRVRLHISYDLQVFDAWSLFRLFDEWFQLYQNPDVVLPPLELSFRDYVLAEQSLQNTELYQKSQDYWFTRLDNFPPAPDLPLAKNPQELKQHRCKRHDGRLDETEWQELKQRAAQAGLTPSGVLIAAFAEILTVWGNNPRFTINLALFNRLPLHHQVNDILGDFTSVTLLAVDNSTPESFSDRARRIQQQLWQDLEHRYFSGVRVVRELARRQGTAPSAMPIVFTSTLGFGKLGQKTLTFSHFGELVYGISQASQAWMDIQVWEEKGELTFNWDVVEELFPVGLIEDMFEAYCRFLKQLATSESTWLEITRQLIPPAQLSQREAINATAVPIPDQMLHTLFAAQAQQRFKQPAVISSSRTLTYQELYELSNQVGHRLRQLGATPNQLVAVVMEKGWEQIVAVLGILNSGAAYLPIDPTLPQERLFYLLENSEAKIILTQSWLNQKLYLPSGIQCLCINTEELASESNQPLQPLQTPDDLAYVIYTSGSTGKPKGVMITHRNVVNVVIQTNKRFNVSPQDRILALTALNHDLSVYDIFGLLCAGGTIIIPDASAVKDPAHWAELIVREKVTLWNSVPAMMEMLVDYVEEQSSSLSSSLRLAILGGDWLPISLPNRLLALVPGVQILSIGGPTETTIWNIGYLVKEVNPNWKSIPYGQPMANSKYYIFKCRDAKYEVSTLEDCPVWVPGEMYCAGVQLAKGYWRDREKTNAHFITHPRTGERIYRTGDLGRYLPDGNIEFLARVDFQIKIRGNRIEAGEIEAALIQHPAVRSAAVTAIGKQNTKERLVAYVVPEQKPEPTIEELRSFLKAKLSEQMIPSAFVFLDALPLSANGKVDRRALPTQESLLEEVKVAYVAPQNKIEQTIANIWQEILEQEKVGVNDKFFDLGGNSLLLTQMYSKLKQALPNEMQPISVVDLFKYSTIRALTQHISTQQKTSYLKQQTSDLNKELKEGKNRLNQRYKKSANT